MTNAPFDPYHRWLGIPPADQPPDHYRLLGVPRFESNIDVILAAANRQSGYLRTFQIGDQAALAQMLLNRVTAARMCLLNTNRKAIYDSHLRAMYSAEGVAGPEAIPAPPQREYDGSVFGEYMILDQLATSRTGQILKASHRSTGRVVALKVLTPETVATPGRVQQFHQKLKILARLSHPNLVAAYDGGQREGLFYLIMECVDGQDLVSSMKQYGPFPLDQAVNCIAQAAGGLGYAHSQGVFHRNVKPGNLLLDSQGVIRVVGFGTARIAADSPLSDDTSTENTDAIQLLGTLDYMAPEQAVDSNTADARSDIYGLGCSLYAVLTARLPYPVRSPADKILAHRDYPIPSLSKNNPEIPSQLDAVFHKMVAKRPEDRYQSMDEVQRALLASVAEK
jgi:serine/threonine-protein kinase